MCQPIGPVTGVAGFAALDRLGELSAHTNGADANLLVVEVPAMRRGVVSSVCDERIRALEMAVSSGEFTRQNRSVPGDADRSGDPNCSKKAIGCPRLPLALGAQIAFVEYADACPRVAPRTS